MNGIYTFGQQLAEGKKAEEVVLKYLRQLSNTVDVKDLSEDKSYQVLGIDALLIYEGENGVYYCTFFDVKADFHAHRTGNLFFETSTDSRGDGGILTTKAEYFLYYEPVFGKLYWIPIHPLREWYNKYGIGKKHITVPNKGYNTEGVAVSIDEILRAIPSINVENIGSLKDASIM